MVPAKQNITIMRGDTEVFNISLSDSTNQPIDLTGNIFSAQIRYNPDDVSIAAEFSCVITNASGGQLRLTLLPSASAALDVGSAFWDLQRNDSGVITTVLAGKCTILADVTR